MTALNVAIIPARGGSRRLPDKNIKLLCGKPLIVWTIEAALASMLFDVVLVTTDCETIATISRAAGASVPFLRPASLATDTATTNDVISHAVDWIEENRGKVARVTLLQPTSPLRNAADITGAMAFYEEKRASAIVSVCQTEHPIQFCNTLPGDLAMAGFIKPEALKRSQELEPWYRLNGAIYIFDRRYVGRIADLYADNTFAWVMSREHSVDIDSALDFMLAEALLRQASAPGPG